MKRLLAAILALLLLAGCSAPAQETQPSTETAPTLANEPGIYDPHSAVEQLTDGAVKSYRLERECTGLRRMGQDLLVFFRNGEQTVVEVYSGENCVLKTSATLDYSLDLTSPWVQSNETGLAYVDEKSNELVVLDTDLRIVTQIELPDDMKGTPVLSPDMNTLYYCTDSDVRAFDLRAGYGRLLKSHQVLEQELLFSCFDGEMLACRITERDGDTYVAFLSAKDGETQGKVTMLEAFLSNADNYLLLRREGIVREVIFGDPVQVLDVADEEQFLPVLVGQYAITVCLKAEEETMFCSYDLASGKRISSVMLAGVDSVAAALGDQQGVWLACGKELLYWDLTKSETADTAMYASVRYTAENPDEEGLRRSAERAQALSQQYGVEVHIWNEAVNQQADAAMTPEFHTKAIETGLDALEAGLSQYPANFFTSLAGDDGKLHISLVREIEGNLDGIQFWYAGEPYVAIAVGDTAQRTLYRELSHAMDTFIIGRSREYDDWEALNPEGFAYDYSYDVYFSREDSPYLVPENRAFINSYAMTYPNEDRASIMEYAMIPEGAAYFTSDIMQSKLLKMCEAIREAFGWEEDSQAFVWEQYLSEPIAYTEEN